MRKNGLRIACRILYELVGKYLPNKNAWVFGRMAKRIRYRLAKGFICSMGRGVVIERNARIPSSLCIGNGSGIGCNAFIDAQVSIGDHVMMGPDVAIYTRNHKHELNGEPFCAQGYEERKPVVIGNNVWIGTRCIILPGVHIADHAVIGAGAVVTHDVPSGVVVAGNPAKIVKYL